MPLQPFSAIFDEVCVKIKQTGRVEEISTSFLKLQFDSERFGVAAALLKEFEILPCKYSCDKGNKNLAKSVSLRSEGNRAFQCKKDNEALRLYTDCIAFAPFPSELAPVDGKSISTDALALGFANRSAVYFSKGQYIACLSDIEQALKYNYPNSLRYKLLERKGRCLKYQGKIAAAQVCYKEAIENLPSSSLQDVKKEALQVSLCNQLKSIQVTDCLAVVEQQNSGPVMSYRQHHNIPSASDCVDVEFNPDMGRLIHATRDIHAGDVVIVEKPYASVLLPNCFKTHCYNCLQRQLALIPCLNCSMVMFCCDSCRNESWEKNHSIDCGILPVLIELGFQKMEHLALRIVIMASVCGRKLQELYRRIKDVERIPEEVHKWLGFDEEGLYKSDTYLPIYHLIANTEKRSVGDLFKRAAVAACLLDCLEYRSHMFTNADLDTSRMRELLGGLLLRHLQNLPCNAHEVSDYVRETIVENRVMLGNSEIGAAAYATLSLLNHSCDPNVTRTSHMGATAVLQAIRPIKAGEEILDNYGYHYALHSREKRLSSLEAQYYFRCQCEACANDWPLYLDLPQSPPGYKCLHCRYALEKTQVICELCKTKIDSKKLQKQIDVFSHQFQEILSKLLSGVRGDFSCQLRKHLEFLDCQFQRPWVEYNDCQEALKQCFFSAGNYYVS